MPAWYFVRMTSPPNRSIFRAFFSAPGLLVSVSVVYAAASTLRNTEALGRRPFVAVTLGVVLAALAIAAFERVRGAVSATRASGAQALYGLALVVVAAGDFTRGHAHELIGLVGAALCAYAASSQVAELSGPPSFVRKPTSSPKAVHVLLGGLVLVGAFTPSHTILLALAGMWALLVAHAWWTLRERYLELGALAHARAILAANVVIGASALSFAWGRALDTVLLLTLAVALSGAFGTWLAARSDALRIERVSRRILTLVVYAGPVIFIGASTAAFSRWDAGTMTVATALLTALVATVAATLEEPFLPERGAWLFAMRSARRVLLERDTEDAVKEALVELRKPWGALVGSPEFWTFHPTRSLTVDRAGYTRERAAELPREVIEAAKEEPFSTLRYEVLSALEVRRPDLRAALKWFEEHGAFAATLIVSNGEPVGLLVLPHAGRSAPLSMEEATEMKKLADSLVRATDTRAALERSFAREQVVQTRLGESEDLVERLKHTIGQGDARHVAAAERLARPLAAGIHSGGFRMAYEALEKRIAHGAPALVVAPPGVDPIPMIARAHLKGPRGEGALVVVDGTSSRDHDLARWKDKNVSPLGLAHQGLLVLVDGASFPHDVQRLVAHALSERRPPWERAEPLDIAIAMTSALPVSVLAEEGRLDPQLLARLSDALEQAVVLPRLVERMEDLRAMVSERLARHGMRVRGTPLGIDDAAMALLVEHPFEAEEVELDAIVVKLVRVCPDSTVRKEHVERVLFGLKVPPQEDELSARRSRRKVANKTK